MKMSSSGSHADHELPAVDERIVAPESGYEIDDGKLVRVPPADEPHAECHSKIAALLEAHVGPEFKVAIDMLTRTSEIDDLAPDASVYPRARDPRTGGRQLEHLAFEIVSTQALAVAGGRAVKLTERGVRRVFAIDVARERVFEWSRELGTWSLLDPRGSIEDRALAVALPLEALVGVTATDEAVAAALIAKGNATVVAALARGRAEGEAEGRAAGVEEGLVRRSREWIARLLARRGLEATAGELARICNEHDLRRLDEWLERAVSCSSVAELFDA